MPDIWGHVKGVTVARDVGKVWFRTTGNEGKDLPGITNLNIFYIYRDGETASIDPTEMVKRNWLIILLERAMEHQYPTLITHSSSTSPMVIKIQVVTDGFQ